LTDAEESQAMRVLFAVAIMTLGFGGCADKRKADLEACSAKNHDVQRELAATRAENASLKRKAAKMDELIAQLAAVTVENEKLKAAAASSTRAGKQ
jgi:hypothetical protein